MAIREYTFITGPETDTLPTVGTPTDADDLVTLDYLENNYKESWGWTADRVLEIDSSGILTASAITTTELGYLDNVTSNIQTQINSVVSAGRVNKNYIINGNFDFWQRGTSFTTLEYGADRFLNSISGSASTMSRQTFTLGQTDVPNNPTYFTRMAVTTGSGASHRVRLLQRIEYVSTLSGTTATLSFWIKADASKNISVEFAQNFGTGGSPSAPVDAIGVVKYAVNTTWQKITHTAAIPSIAGKTLGTSGGDYLVSFIWLDAGSDYNARTDSLGNQSGTFDFAQIKLEEGAAATDFCLAGDTIGGELSACQRYYYDSGAEYYYPSVGQRPNHTGIAENTSYITVLTGFPQVLRVAPAITIGGWGETPQKVATIGTTTNIGTAAMEVTTDADGRIAILRIKDTGTPFTAGDHYWFYLIANAEI